MEKEARRCPVFPLHFQELRPGALVVVQCHLKVLYGMFAVGKRINSALGAWDMGLGIEKKPFVLGIRSR